MKLLAVAGTGVEINGAEAVDFGASESTASLVHAFVLEDTGDPPLDPGELLYLDPPNRGSQFSTRGTANFVGVVARYQPISFRTDIETIVAVVGGQAEALIEHTSAHPPTPGVPLYPIARIRNDRDTVILTTDRDNSSSPIAVAMLLNLHRDDVGTIILN